MNGVCFGCREPFLYDPATVARVLAPMTDEREPICEACVAKVNAVRERAGLRPLRQFVWSPILSE